jgi:hypothetical protein
MKILFVTIGVLAICTLAAVTPDLRRYLRIRSM